MLAFLKANPSCRTILVEKTDRLYRNFKDYVTVEDLNVAIHFVKENTVLSPDTRSAEKLMHNIRVAMAKNYTDNLSEEVKKGLREKAEQGHWPGVAHVGYVNNRTTRRIDVDPIRGPLVARVFTLYATGEYSLLALTRTAYTIGLRHWRGDRRMTKSEIHRMLQNPIYTGDFLWMGQRRRGSHEPLITHETFDAVQTVLRRKPRARYPKQRRVARLRAVRVLDDRREEEGQVRLLPLHRVQGRVRQHVHPRGAIGGPAGRRREADPDHVRDR